jgi:hypothetical protein
MRRPRLPLVLLPFLATAACGAGVAASGSDAGSGTGISDASRDVTADSPAPLDGSAALDGSSAPIPLDAPFDASDYANASMWLCGANAPHDYCLDPQTVTAIHPDLSQSTSTPAPAGDPALDCFYIYPSVDITSPPGNEPNFDNLQDILDPVHSQAAPFSQVCKVYAPLYHQATYQSYFSPDADEYLERAYEDVAAAFQEYLTAYNAGRPFVLLGHSQGSHMLRRLIQRVVETTPSVQSRMALAILAGSLGDVAVPKGQVVGGTFQSTPLCTSATQRGCIFTFSTFAKGYEPTSTYPDFPVGAGMDVACSNPAAPAGGKAYLANTLFFTQYMSPTLDPPQNTGVSTPFAAYATFYTGQCTPSAAGYSFFEVDPEPDAGDQRTNPIPFSALIYSPSVIGLHLLDFAFPMGDCLAAVQARTTGASDASAE